MSFPSLPDIRNLSLSELEQWFLEQGEKTFRSKQVYEWLWKKSVVTFEEMTNLSQDIRHLLNQSFSIRRIRIEKTQKSNDRTIKTAFRLYDDALVEGVLIPTTSRMTACISSQAGCSLSCKFCATGKLKLKRNLNAFEIYDQIVSIRRQSEENYHQPLTNIVYMGMGEPLLNYRNVMDSIEKVTSDKGLGMSPQRITVSTAGISKMITKLGDDGAKFNLALSLHAADDEKRSKIMPINDSNNLDVLANALTYFYDKTGTRPTLEYIIFREFNDSLKDAANLVQFARKIPAKVNIIEYNTVEGTEFKRAGDAETLQFKDYLESKGVIATIRRSRGRDIDAACGQLANNDKIGPGETKQKA